MDHSEIAGPAEEIDRLRKALDAATEERLAVQRKLDRANLEFAEFVAMTAHNLRESLRDVASFSQLLAEAAGARLDAEAGDYLTRVRAGASRMDSLLSDVVDYWAAEEADWESSRVDMEAVLCHALLAADREISGKGAIVTHDPLPPVKGSFEMLSRVLRHLIRNAIEYGAASAPRVHISSRREGQAWAFSVCDNGPGIEAGLQARVFDPLRRLHGREHSGNGLGLAFCRKSVEQHGGRMWLESTPGEGSTFHFTLSPAE